MLEWAARRGTGRGLQQVTPRDVLFARKGPFYIADAWRMMPVPYSGGRRGAKREMPAASVGGAGSAAASLVASAWRWPFS